MPWVKLLSVTEWEKHIHTPGNFKYPVHSVYMSGRKPEHSEETGADMVRTCKHHTGKIQLTGSDGFAGLSASSGQEVLYHTKLAGKI